ncbi:MAG: hypothetical protein A2017_15035 [Lentisphaerae bacterium GWF2_44_16]|nr:MAG: hypothetical protein A2017_15035 [Lentisphaerae bacterium GWF2_44_16]
MEKIKLQTPVVFNSRDIKFSSQTVLCGIGSCFAKDILERFFDSGFRGAQNPNGIVYNAVSIFESLKRIVANESYKMEEFFEHNGIFHSWTHHGSFSSESINEALTKANAARSEFREFLNKCNLFIITPSSSVVYEYITGRKIVANCHKVPNNKFERRLLSPEENYKALSDAVHVIKSFNSSCRILFTLSPVRHYPGELILNSQSKAHLLTAIHRCLHDFPELLYFPSYEIMLDELRDYRFYNEDMLHPNELARKIIFERFLETYFDSSAKQLIENNEKLNLSSKHRPLNS